LKPWQERLGRRVHLCFPDRAKTDDIDDFRKVRDDIARDVSKLVTLAG
jgi:hypothetical protein